MLSLSDVRPRRRIAQVIRIGNHDILSLERGADGKVSVSAAIFDQDGILLEIRHGRFKVYRGDAIKHERPDSHTLVVYDKWNVERARVTYLNQNAINITGTFFYPGHAPIVADGTSLTLGNNAKLSGGGCFGGNGGADIAID
jgi:hypothetical protein